MKHSPLVLLLVFAAVALSQGDFLKVIHNTDPNAKCLDGSGAMVYLH